MGIFDLFGSASEREQSQLKKLARKVTEKYGPSENRMGGIDALAALGTPGALKTLCLRFTLLSDPGITDQEEKESVHGHLVDAGGDAVGPVTEFIREQETGIAWGLRALATVTTPEAVLDVVVAELTRLSTVYTRDPEKKLTLLAWVSEHHAGVEAAGLDGVLRAMLEDFSDDVRISAARALAGLPLSEPSRTALIELLVRDAGNARVRGEVLAALHRLGADVKGFRPSVEALLVEPWYLDKDGVVKRHG
jgi:hypothetical protein